MEHPDDTAESAGQAASGKTGTSRAGTAMTARVVYSGARALRLEAAAIEPPGHGQVRISVAFTGICGTDLHIYHGDMDSRVTVPCVPAGLDHAHWSVTGHEPGRRRHVGRAERARAGQG